MIQNGGEPDCSTFLASGIPHLKSTLFKVQFSESVQKPKVYHITAALIPSNDDKRCLMMEESIFYNPSPLTSKMSRTGQKVRSYLLPLGFEHGRSERIEKTFLLGLPFLCKALISGVLLPWNGVKAEVYYTSTVKFGESMFTTK